MSSFANLLRDYDKVVFFDTETTGLDSKTCHVIEFAMRTLDRNNDHNEYDEFIRLPEGEHVPGNITELTHITDEMVQGGVFAADAVTALMNEIENKRVLMIAHNCQFDLCFLKEMICRVYSEGEADRILSGLDWLDSLTVFKDRKAYPHKLCNAIEYYGIEDAENSHRAIDDTKALEKVCFAMDEERQDLNTYVNIFGFNPKYGVSGDQFHKIQYIAQPYYDGMTPADAILPATAFKNWRKFPYLAAHHNA